MNELPHIGYTEFNEITYDYLKKQLNFNYKTNKYI